MIIRFGNINTIENHRANHAVRGVWFGNNAYTRLITHMQIRYNAIRNGFWSGFNMKIEQRHDKTNKMICAPREDSDQTGISLGIRLVTESVLSTWNKIGS